MKAKCPRCGGAGTVIALTLAERLTVAREALGISQREAAKRCGVSDPYLCQLERGRVKEPSLAVALKLSKLYGIPLDEMASYGGKP